MNDWFPEELSHFQFGVDFLETTRSEMLDRDGATFQKRYLGELFSVIELSNFVNSVNVTKST